MWLWGQVRNPCNICFAQFRRQLESYHWEADRWSPRCTARRTRWRSRAARCWPIDRIVSRQSWRHSWRTWRWGPLSWKLGRGVHLRPAITALVEVMFLALLLITWKSLACAGGWWRTVHHRESRMVKKLQSAWNQLLWWQVTIHMLRMILIGVLPKSTAFASGSVPTMVWCFWIVVTVLFQAK